MRELVIGVPLLPKLEHRDAAVKHKHEVPEGAAYCPTCGTRVPKVRRLSQVLGGGWFHKTSDAILFGLSSTWPEPPPVPLVLCKPDHLSMGGWSVAARLGPNVDWQTWGDDLDVEGETTRDLVVATMDAFLGWVAKAPGEVFGEHFVTMVSVEYELWSPGRVLTSAKRDAT